MSYAYKATHILEGRAYTVGGFSTAKEARKYLAMSLIDNGFMTKTKAQQGAASLRTKTVVQVQGWELSINKEGT